MYLQTGENMKWAETFVWCLLLNFKVVYWNHLTQLLPFAWDFIMKGQWLVWGQVGSQQYFQYHQAWDPPWQASFFTGILLDLAGLLAFFKFLRRHPVANRLCASGRNWFRTIIMTTNKQVGVFCIVFHDMMLNCDMWPVLHSSERQETSSAAENWPWRWTTTDLIQCHSSWPGRICIRNGANVVCEGDCLFSSKAAFFPPTVICLCNILRRGITIRHRWPSSVRDGGSLCWTGSHLFPKVLNESLVCKVWG